MPKSNNLVVLGNPPYQKPDGGNKNSASPLYHLFIEEVLKLEPRYHSFIVPSRWMQGGKGLGKFRSRMMKDKRLRLIKHFPGSFSVFGPLAKIDGGCNYYLWDREYLGECSFNGMHRHLDEYDIILTDNESVSILDKVLSVHGKKPFLDTRVLPRKPFGVGTAFNEWVPAPTGPDLTGRVHGVDISLCYAQAKAVRSIAIGKYTDTFGILNKWKVCIGEAFGESKAKPPYTVCSTPFLIEPGSLCTETYIVLGSFDTRQEAENFQAYVKTRFFKFMLLLRKITLHINKEKFSWVPDLGSYATAPTDALLFQKYGLTSNEINYINKRVK